SLSVLFFQTNRFGVLFRLSLFYRKCPSRGQAYPERRPATSTPTPALSPSRGILFAHSEKVESRMVLGKRGCPCRIPLRIEEQSIMADQRAFGNADRSPTE